MCPIQFQCHLTFLLALLKQSCKAVVIKLLLGLDYFGEEGYQINIRFEVFMPVTMKNAVFWDVTPCASC
jgi:hypothetical protein